MKKIVVVIACVSLFFAALALVGCTDVDLSALEERIAQLEQELAYAREHGIPGPQGEPGRDGVDGQPGPEGPAWQPELNRIYQLGETFTFVNGGLELFSVRVETSFNPMVSFYMHVSNYNVPQLAPSTFIRARIHTGGNTFINEDLSTNILPIGQSRVEEIRLIVASYIWLGLPLPGLNALIPFVVFSVA